MPRYGEVEVYRVYIKDHCTFNQITIRIVIANSWVRFESVSQRVKRETAWMKVHVNLGAIVPNSPTFSINRGRLSRWRANEQAEPTNCSILSRIIRLTISLSGLALPYLRLRSNYVVYSYNISILRGTLSRSS